MKNKSFSTWFVTLILLFGLVAYNSNAQEHNTSYHYDGQLQLTPESGALSANWNISITNPNQLNATFVLRSSLHNVKVVSRHLVSFSVKQSALGDDFKQIDIVFQRGKPNQIRHLNMTYKGVLLPEPMSNQINQLTADAIELNVDSFWFPMDARFNQLLTANLTIDIDKGWQAVGAGIFVETDNGFEFQQTDPALDIAFSLSPTFKISKMPGYSLYDLRPNDTGIGKLNQTIQFCLTNLSNSYSNNDPLNHLNFTINNRPSSGYARKNYIALTDITDTPEAQLTQFVCHEIAHHWSRHGKFDTEENWLNEAFAEYVGLRMLRLRFGLDAFEQRIEQFVAQLQGKTLGPVWTKELTSRPTYLVSYRKAVLQLKALEDKIGEGLFSEFLTLYMTQQTKTTEQLLSHLLSVTNKDVQRWFIAQLAL